MSMKLPPKLTINDLVTHRFRGFAPNENTVEGFIAALDSGVRHLEFDIRVARCGTPMIYHDAQAKDSTGQDRYLCNYKASEFARLGGTFSYIPTAEDLLDVAGRYAAPETRLLIDIKDAGFEDEIIALVNLNRLQDRTVYVSWVPEVLYAVYARDPKAQLCLSHWCQTPPKSEHVGHDVFEAKNNEIPDTGRRYIHGGSSGWFTQGPLRGTLRDIVSFVCVPQDMVTPDLVAGYQKDNIKVSTYSYLDWDHIKAHKSDMNVDLFFIDNKDVFDAL